MTRRSLLFGLASLPCPAAAEPEVTSPAIQFAVVGPIDGVSIPAVSSAAARYSVLVQVYSDDPDVECYAITLRYQGANDPAPREQTKAVLRQRASRDQWTPEVFFVGEPVAVLGITARELKCSAEASIRGCAQ